jgi:hypothetical protein
MANTAISFAAFQKEVSSKAWGALSSATVVAFCLQLAISPTIDNIVTAAIAAIVSIGTVFYLFGRPATFSNYPLSTLGLLGLTVSTELGALLYQSFTWTPLDLNLEAPVKTFFLVGILHAVIVFSHMTYTKLSVLRQMSEKLSKQVYARLWLFHSPSAAQLWLMGFLGVWATWYTATTVRNLEYGDFTAKFINGLMPFAYAPVLLPFLSLLGGGEKVRQSRAYLGIAGYFVLLIAISLASNSRSTFAVGFITVGLIFFLLFATGKIQVEQRIKTRLLLLIIPAFIVISSISDLALAMVIVRDQRSEVTGWELARLTWDTFWDPRALEAQRQTLRYLLEEGYNEVYITNPIFARLVTIKFDDNMIYYGTFIGPDRAAELLRVSWEKIVTLLPSPVLSFLGIGLDKANLEFSMGDYIYYMASDSNFALGQYKVGSFTGHGIVALGAWFYPLMFLISPVVFIVLDGFAQRRKDGLYFAPIILISAYSVFTVFNGDSAVNIVAYLLRGLPQAVLLYLSMMFVLNALIPGARARQPSL